MRYFIFVCLAFLGFNGYSQNNWNETFETSTAQDWEISNGTWEIGTPTSGPGGAYQGQKCAATVLNGNYSDHVESRLISPAFTVPAAGENPRLRFWHWFNIGAYDYGVVQVKVKGNSNWIDISQKYINTGSGIWTRPLIDLSNFAGQEIQIAFHFVSTSYYVSPGWYIDDINIETGANSFQFPETWESGLGNWNSESGTWEVGIPTSGPGGAYKGLNCAATVLNGNYSDHVESRLISPVFTVPAAGENPRLRFWHWFNIGAYDYGVVQVKLKGNSNWIDVSQKYINTGSGVWTRPVIDLSSFAGQEIQVAFHFVSTSYYISPGWFIDDINIETGPNSFQFPETWESGLGNWNSESGTWEVGTPSSGPGGAYKGLKCAATVLNGNYSDHVESRLISPVFTVPGAGENPRLRFWHWYNIGAYDYGVVQVKVKGNSNWIDVSQKYINTGSGVWTRPLIDLSSFAGQEIQIAFHFVSTSYYISPGWYIDDINIETGALSFQNPETWEKGLGNWNCESGTWEVGIPSSGPGGAYKGLNCAATVLSGNYSDHVESRLISPVFTVPAAGENPKLRFWHWFNIGAYDYGIVQVKLKGQSTWIDVSQQYINTGSGVWTRPVIDLSSFAGQEIQVAFHFVSTSYYVSPGWFIDNVEILPIQHVETGYRDTTICTGNSLALAPDFSGGALPYKYQWSTGETTGNITLNAMHDTLVWCKLTDVNNWTDYDTINIHTIDIPEYTVEDTDTIIYPETFEMFRILMKEAYEYNIEPAPDSIVASNNILTVYVSPDAFKTEYNIDCWKSLSDCHTYETATVINQNFTGINSTESDFSGYIIYPNPAENMINIQAKRQEELLISIYNASGALIQKQAYYNSLISIPIETWPDGIYLIRIQNDLHSLQRIFIKQ
jgi:bacillopeptidase F (M6 metalloprotease family)